MRYSPLQQVRRYFDGGYVDPMISDAMAQDLEDFGATNLDEIWGADVNAGNVLDAADYYTENPEGSFFLPSNSNGDLSALVNQLVQQDAVQRAMVDLGPAVQVQSPQNIPTVVANTGAQQTPTQQVARDEAQPPRSEQPVGGLIAQAIPGTNSALVQLPDGRYAVVPTAQQKPEQSQWSKLLQLGLGGLGALTSYNAASDARKRAENYDSEQRLFGDQQNALYGQATQRLNTPYAAVRSGAVRPAATRFTAPT